MPEIITRKQILYGSVKTMSPADVIATQTGDTVNVTLWGTQSGVSVKLSMSSLTEDGEFITSEHTLVYATAYAAQSQEIALGAAYMVSMSLRVVTTTAPPNSMFGVVNMYRGGVTNGQLVKPLMRGFMGYHEALTFPSSPFVSALDGVGSPTVLTLANPGAGNNFIITVPSGVCFIIDALEFLFTASAAAANRRVSIRIDDGTNEIHKVEGNADITATQARTHSVFTNSQPSNGNNVTIYMPIPLQLRLLPGYRVRSVVSALDAGDTFTLISYAVRQFPYFAA